MEPFKLSCKFLSLCGVWRPDSCSKKWHTTLFQLYRFFIVPLPYLLSVGLLGRLILHDLSSKELSETIFLYVLTSGICFKSYNFLRHQKDMLNLFNMLCSKYSTPHNEIESAIHRKYYQFIRFITLSVMALVVATVVSWLSPPFFQEKNHRSLPLKIWLPINNSHDRIFWITYVHNALSLIIISAIAIGNDTMFVGFLLLINEQFDLLYHRLIDETNYVGMAVKYKMPQYKIKMIENKLTRQNVRHHLFIFEFADAISKTFGLVIVTQFMASSMVISLNIYQLSSSGSFNIELLQALLSLSSMLTELFIYCWFGNEILIKSQKFSNSILKTDWSVLSIQSKKKLLFMSLRAQNPIVIQIGHLIVLSLDSFTKILKTSYTAFNLLRN